MPIIQNFDFSKNRPRNKKPKSQNLNLNENLKSKDEKSRNEKSKLKQFSQNELLMIKESLKFFRKISNDESMILQTFGLTSEQFFIMSHSIFDKIFWNIEYLSSNGSTVLNELDSKTLEISHWESKPQSNYKREPTLIEKLRLMSKTERLKYWEKNSK